MDLCEAIIKENGSNGSKHCGLLPACTLLASPINKKEFVGAQPENFLNLTGGSKPGRCASCV